MKRLVTLLVFLLVMMLQSCEKYPQNPNAPNAVFDITINLSDPRYQALRYDGNYMYLTSDPESTSRGIIVYRVLDSFVTYDRLPPNNPNCLNANGNLTRLIVDTPFVIDECNDIKYSILDGYIFEGEGVYGLYRYENTFDGLTLRIRSRLV